MNLSLIKNENNANKSPNLKFISSYEQCNSLQEQYKK